MNIIAKTFGGGVCCRPDTSWEKENRDFYCPECAGAIHWAPVVFARISKAGKCVGEKFASRYYDAMGFGMLMYIGDLLPDIASASCADHTTILPFPLYNTVVFDNPDNTFSLKADGALLYSCSTLGCRKTLEEAICKSSVLTSLRTGDIVAVELSEPCLLSSRSDKEKVVAATFCDNDLFDFKIIW